MIMLMVNFVGAGNILSGITKIPSEISSFVKFKVNSFSNYTMNCTDIVSEFSGNVFILLMMIGIIGLMIVGYRK